MKYYDSGESAATVVKTWIESNDLNTYDISV